MIENTLQWTFKPTSFFSMTALKDIFSPWISSDAKHAYSRIRIKTIWLSWVLTAHILSLLVFAFFFPLEEAESLVYLTSTSLLLLVTFTNAIPLLTTFKKKNRQIYISKIFAFTAFVGNVAILITPNIYKDGIHFDIAYFTIFFVNLVYTLEYKQLAKNQTELETFEMPHIEFTKKITSTDTVTEIKTVDLQIGDRVLVEPNEIIPCDGKILTGITSVDESFITKEVRAQYKSPGSQVTAGTLNRDNPIHIEVTALHEDSILSNITKLKNTLLSPSSKFQKKSMAPASYLLLFLTLIGVAFTAILSSTSLHLFHLGIAVQVLLLGVSLSLTSVCFIASQNLIVEIFNKGILLSKEDTLKKLANLESLFFQKTGILTKGKFTYSQEWIQHGNSLGEFLSVALSLEHKLKTPLGKAMSTHPWYNEIQKYKVESSEFHPGLGVSGVIKTPEGKTHKAYVGNLRFLKRFQCHISRELKNKMDELESIGETVVLCAYDRQAKGIIAFSDILRSDVKATFATLKNAGLKLSLLTGDTEKNITQALGEIQIDSVHSRCTPEEKTTQIEKQKQAGLLTGLVSNNTDSSVFSTPDITFSTNTGTKIRNHKADVIIMGSDVYKIAWLVEKAKRFRKLNRLNLMGSVGLMGINMGALAFGYFLPIPILLASFGFSFFLYKNKYFKTH